MPIPYTFAIGAGASIAGALFFARPVGRFLTAVADALDTFRESWKGATTRRPARAPKTAEPTLDPIQSDVVSALKNQGMSERKAIAHVLAVGTAENFETLFRRASSTYPVTGAKVAA